MMYLKVYQYILDVVDTSVMSFIPLSSKKTIESWDNDVKKGMARYLGAFNFEEKFISKLRNEKNRLNWDKEDEYTT